MGQEAMIITFLKHDCGVSNLVQLFNGQKPTKCGFYWYWKGGDTYIGGLHYFTWHGYRIVLRLMIKK